MASNTGSIKRLARREMLRKIQDKVQMRWYENNVFNATSRETPPKPGEKFFGTFPIPYMNGDLHLGHAHTLCKAEFTAAFHRLRGANVLLPFSFHGSGMPIKASADKLRREIQTYGNPPVFPIAKDKNTDPNPQPEGKQCSPQQFKGKKSKEIAKAGGNNKHQWEILQMCGIPNKDIPLFQDPYHWLVWFPGQNVDVLKSFGLSCDWRRTFITTDTNPFFDSFVRWQMRKLKKMGKIVKDLRYTIFSPLDGQPCADHDRALGEGVVPQEYTLIKMEVVSPLPPKLSVLRDKKVYLAAATLRPETMYGQTNAWVMPEGKYGAFEINETEVFILTERSALNLAYQKHSLIPNKPTCLVELTGSDLIGIPLRSPLALYDIIYSLPMSSILLDKGTGIVTSVPSESPDDFMNFSELRSKEDYRTKLGLDHDWVVPFEAIPIISTPEFGDKSAEKVCFSMNIKSSNEKKKLEEAKKKIYKGGFYEGNMIVGEYAGMRIQDAKSLIKKKLIENGKAVVYYEPENKVVSRSGDGCVVALTDQWYITYGESSWRKEAEECLASMNLFPEETRHMFKNALSWLKQWACSRNFGLGTRIPWDEEFLVESLSDSTLYMVYYTVCHLLQRGDMYGSDTSSVRPEQLTDEVWDFVFCGGPYPQSSEISSSILNEMKQEFEYWYPFDDRVSGKDLIQNHLTFLIYHHVALLRDHHLPTSIRCNGHLMLNSEKMSKSTGNFMTLRQAIEKFTADPTRFALADAGDGMDDANFSFETANTAILRLTKEIKWMQENISAKSSLRTGPPTTFADRVFANEINFAVKKTEENYLKFLFREVLKSGFYDLQSACDEYILSCGLAGMNADLFWRFIDVQMRLISPICSHYAEYVWSDILMRDGFVINAGWPECESPDLTLKKANEYLQNSIVSLRKIRYKLIGEVNKSKENVQTLPNKPILGLIYVNDQYDGWKAVCLNILRNKFDFESSSFAPEHEIVEALQKSPLVQGDRDNILRLCMPFLKLKKLETSSVGVQALDLKLAFGEKQVLSENSELIRRQLGLERVEILCAKDPKDVERAGSHALLIKNNPPSPGNPTAVFISQ